MVRIVLGRGYYAKSGFFYQAVYVKRAKNRTYVRTKANGEKWYHCYFQISNENLWVKEEDLWPKFEDAIAVWFDGLHADGSPNFDLQLHVDRNTMRLKIVNISS